MESTVPAGQDLNVKLKVTLLSSYANKNKIFDPLNPKLYKDTFILQSIEWMLAL